MVVHNASRLPLLADHSFIPCGCLILPLVESPSTENAYGTLMQLSVVVGTSLPYQ